VELKLQPQTVLCWGHLETHDYFHPSGNVQLLLQTQGVVISLRNEKEHAKKRAKLVKQLEDMG